jgi:tetratricopeptide (TPR) repeat protein
VAELYAGEPAPALAAFRTERELQPGWPEADLRAGQALAALGDPRRAREAYARSLAKHPELGEARDSLAALTAAGKR